VRAGDQLSNTDIRLKRSAPRPRLITVEAQVDSNLAALDTGERSDIITAKDLNNSDHRRSRRRRAGEDAARVCDVDGRSGALQPAGIQQRRSGPERSDLGLCRQRGRPVTGIADGQ
jgi:hypothetical protein